MHPKGFHLIEILVVLAIAAIMSQWIANSYTSMIAKERRREAEHALYALASALEGYALQHATYAGATLSKLKLQSRTASNHYKLKIDSANQQQFLISARPILKQAEVDARCGTLLLTSNGEKSMTGTGSQQECW